MHLMTRLSLARIERAASLIDPVFLHSPQFDCEPLSQAVGARVLLKVETMNPIRSFKGRGAELLVANVPRGDQVITASAGNFGQAVAYACRPRGMALTVYAAESANQLKVERMRQLGAKVILAGRDFDEAKGMGRAAAQSRGIRFVEDGRDIETAEGAGTIGLELSNASTPPAAVLIPLGNGGLFAGVAQVLRARLPGTRRIAVQAAGAPAMVESWRAGRVVAHEQLTTIADGIGVRVPIPEILDDLRDLIDDAILVRDETILRAMRLVHQHAGLVVEPSGAVGIAALLEDPARFREQHVATILCGGNLTPEQMRDWL